MKNTSQLQLHCLIQKMSSNAKVMAARGVQIGFGLCQLYHCSVALWTRKLLNAKTNKQQTNKRTNKKTNKPRYKQIKIVQQNLSGLIAYMDRVVFLNSRTLPPNDEVPEKSIWARLDDTRAS